MNTISFQTWFNQNERSILLDLRSPADYATKRLAAEHVSIPLASLRKRSYELPPRSLPFDILVGIDSLEAASAILIENTTSNPRPWKVEGVLLDDSENWTWAKEQDLVDENAPWAPLTRLWQPDPMIEQVLLPKLLNKKPGAVQIFDLGAGFGRDVCFLAHALEANNKHMCITAMDQRYLPPEDEPVVAFFERQKIDHVTKCLRIDLSSVEHVLQTIRDASQEQVCIYAVRFWNQELVQTIAQTMKKENTIFAISQFGKPSVHAEWKWKHPKEKHVLERNQLREMFQESWDILHDVVVQDSDHGRTLIQFVAQRKKSS
jgi:hypothetical protein